MAKKSFYTKSLGKKVAAAAKQVVANRYHVISSEGAKWAVVIDGNRRATKIFESQLNAIDFAKEYATKINGEVVIHEKTGKIADRVSYAK